MMTDMAEKCAHGGVALANQARCRLLSVEEGSSAWRKYSGSHDHGIDARIDIDGVTAAVFGKRTRLARDKATVESRRVVVGHRSVVVGSVIVDEPHFLDREMLLEERLEDRNHLGGDLAVDHQLALVNRTVEADVRQVHVGKLSDGRRAAVVPGMVAHAFGDGDRHRALACLERRPRRGRRSGEQNGGHAKQMHEECHFTATALVPS